MKPTIESGQMAKTATLTLRVSETIKSRLQDLAKLHDRSVSYVAEQAINDRLAIEEAQIRGIEKAIAQADRGEWVEHADAKAWVQTLGSENPLPRPRAKRSGA